MNMNSFEKFVSLKPNLQPSTLEQYGFTLTKTFRNTCATRNENDCDCLQDLSWVNKYCSEIVEELKERFPNMATRRTKVSHFAEVCKQLNFLESWKFFKDYHTSLMKESMSEPTQKRTPKQEEKKITFETFDKMCRASATLSNKILAKDQNSSSEELGAYLIVQESMYLHLYKSFPLRRDLGSCLLIRQDFQDNFTEDPGFECYYQNHDLANNNYIMKNGKRYLLVLNDFKNVKKLGTKTFILTGKVKKYLDWMCNSPANKTDSLLLNKKGNPMTRETFAKTFQTCCQKYTGVKSRHNDWRHGIVNHYFGNDSSLDKRKKVASCMCNSVMTQMTHYEKKE